MEAKRSQDWVPTKATQSHWFQPHNERRSHWPSTGNLGRVGGRLSGFVSPSGRISPRRHKRISPADQQDLRNSELGVRMVRPQIPNIKAFFLSTKRFAIIIYSRIRYSCCYSCSVTEKPDVWCYSSFYGVRSCYGVSLCHGQPGGRHSGSRLPCYVFCICLLT